MGFELSEEEKRKIREYEKLHEHEQRYGERKDSFKQKIYGFLDRLKDWRRTGKGFLNKKDALFNYHEWHAAGWGALLMALYFRLEQGLFLVLYVSGIVKVWTDTHKRCEKGFSYLYSEIGKNLHYYVLAGFLVAELFLMTGASPPSVESGLIATVLSAVLGL